MPDFIVHYRITPEGEHLKETDYLRGFGMDTAHYARVRSKRREIYPKALHREDYKETWERRTGHYIDGSKMNTRHHPLHDIKLKDRKTGECYIVDTVSIHHYFGKFMVLVTRKEGTNSHGTVMWENYTCADPLTIKGVNGSHEKYEVIPMG